MSDGMLEAVKRLQEATLDKFWAELASDSDLTHFVRIARNLKVEGKPTEFSTLLIGWREVRDDTSRRYWETVYQVSYSEDGWQKRRAGSVTVRHNGEYLPDDGALAALIEAGVLREIEKRKEEEGQ